MYLFVKGTFVIHVRLCTNFHVISISVHYDLLLINIITKPVVSGVRNEYKQSKSSCLFRNKFSIVIK